MQNKEGGTDGSMSRGYFTLSSGEKLYYEDTGDGAETLIMMHGWTSSHDIYVKPVQLLKDRARCIIYDHRGHGKSKDANSGHPDLETLASDLNEIITGLRLSDVTLLGWSMGACTAMNYVRKYGCSALKQIVLCDMAPKQINDEEWKLGLYQGTYTQEDFVRDHNRDFPSKYRDFAVHAIPRLKKIPGFLLKKPLERVLAKCDESTVISLSASITEQDNRDILEMVTVPLTYFYADPGSLYLPELAEWYGEHAKVPYHSVKFPKSDHMFIEAYPDQFAEEVAKLL